MLYPPRFPYHPIPPTIAVNSVYCLLYVVCQAVHCFGLFPRFWVTTDADIRQNAVQ